MEMWEGSKGREGGREDTYLAHAALRLLYELEGNSAHALLLLGVQERGEGGREGGKEGRREGGRMST